MSEDMTSTLFRVLFGPRKGQVGMVVSVTPRRDLSGPYDLIELRFADQESSYFKARDLVSVEEGEKF
jgi:hypothetical protein